MLDVIVIGDGPGGLSAALFLAKNGMSVAVYGQDKTAMHAAQLKNYLGIEDMAGSEFQKLARKQAASFGAMLNDARIEKAEQTSDGYKVKTEGGDEAVSRYLILSEGKGPRIAKELGLDYDDKAGIEVDRNGLSKLKGVYVVGRSLRPGRSQAIISAGDGAAAAIDILSREKGEPVCDWDSPE